MEILDIVKETESILPNSFKNATIVIDGKRISLFNYLERDFIKFIKPGATAQVLANFINVRLSERINPNDIRMIKINEFIENNVFFKELIATGPKEDEFINTREYITNYVLENMDDSGDMSYIDSKITIEELYLKLLNNEYQPPTLEDKAELCIDMASYIDPEILASVVDGMDITVEDYITKVLPTKMATITEVSIDGNLEDIDEFIKQIVDHQANLLSEKKDKAMKDKEDEYNKTGDNPNLVSEIQVILGEDKAPEITAEMPVVASSLLTSEEQLALSTNYEKKEGIAKEDYYKNILNKLKDAINTTNNLHDLEAKIEFVEEIENSIKNEPDSVELEPKIEVYLLSIKELIAEKQKNLIKVNGNLEEYTDVLFSEINNMTDELNGFTTLDEFSTLYGKACERFEDAIEKGINDIQLQSAFYLLFERINEKRLNLDSTIGYQSPEVERAKIELNEFISSIKQDVLTIKHDANNLGNLAGTQIRLNLNIEKAFARVEDVYQAGLLTETDREYYRNRLNGYSMAIKSEEKIGLGTR